MKFPSSQVVSLLANSICRTVSRFGLMKTFSIGVPRPTHLKKLNTVFTIKRGMKLYACHWDHSTLIWIMEGPVLILGNARAKSAQMDFALDSKQAKVATPMLTAAPSSFAKPKGFGPGSTNVKNWEPHMSSVKILMSARLLITAGTPLIQTKNKVELRNACPCTPRTMAPGLVGNTSMKSWT